MSNITISTGMRESDSGVEPFVTLYWGDESGAPSADAAEAFALNILRAVTYARQDVEAYEIMLLTGAGKEAAMKFIGAQRMLRANKVGRPDIAHKSGEAKMETED